MARPLGFDRAETLESIQDVFWEHGFSATSLDDIMRCTGLGKGSLYGTYGSKLDMFVAAFADYCAWTVTDLADRLRGPDAGAAGRLREALRHATRSGTRRGCMLGKSTAELAGQYPDVDKLIAKTFATMLADLVACVRQAQRAGEIDPGKDPKTIAVTLLAVLRGLEALKRARVPAATLALVAQGAAEVLGPA